MTSFCPNCKQPLEENGSCRYCGYNAADAAKARTEKKMPPEERTKVNNGQFDIKAFLNKYGAILIFIVALILIFG
jgi:predicted amidophosphoribosyltransferase